MIGSKTGGTILVGESEELFAFYARMKHPERVLGVFCRAAALLPEGLGRLGNVTDVPAFLDENTKIQRVYCAVSQIGLDEITDVQYCCKARSAKFCVVLPHVNDMGVDFVSTRVNGNVVLTPKDEPLTHFYNRFVKRLFDLLLVLVFMLTFFPFIYLVKAFKIKRKRRGTPFVTDLCCGPNGKLFKRVSFRGEINSVARVFNVLKGNMSLVGPTCYELENEAAVATLPKRLERRHVKAGLTGWAKIHRLDEEDRLDADIWYVEHWSAWLDVKILCMSLFK